MAKLKNLISWHPIRKVKAAAVASGVMSALALVGVQMSEDTSNLVEKSIAALAAIWIPVVTAYMAKSREGEIP